MLPYTKHSALRNLSFGQYWLFERLYNICSFLINFFDGLFGVFGLLMLCTLVRFEDHIVHVLLAGCRNILGYSKQVSSASPSHYPLSRHIIAALEDRLLEDNTILLAPIRGILLFSSGETSYSYAI